MSEETNLTKCKKCGELKKRTQSGFFNEKDKRWVDETGGLWNGKSCPTCTRIRVKEAMKKARIGDNV